MRAAYVVFGVGVAVAVALLAGAIRTTVPYQDAPSPALPVYLLVAACATLVIALMAAWTVQRWFDPLHERRQVAYAAPLTLSVVMAAAFAEAAVYAGKHAPWKADCEADRVTGAVACNPHGARDVGTADLRVCVLMIAGVATIALTLAAIGWHERRSVRGGTPGSAAAS